MPHSSGSEFTPRSRPLVGVSRCLLGEPVRYDGTACPFPWITDVLSQHCDFHPLCPEVEAGFGVPRAPIRLIQEGGELAVQLVGAPIADQTSALLAAIERLLPEVEALDGLILKARSPSCGLNDTQMFDNQGGRIGMGAGLFALLCRQHCPDLVIADEQMLASEAGRVSFMVQLLRNYHFGER